MSEEKTMTVIAKATVTPFYANMNGFDIFTVAVFLFYLSVYNCMLSVENGLPWRRHEDIADFHFFNSLNTTNSCPGLYSSVVL